MTTEKATCLRCGIVNAVRSGTREYLCQSCKVYWPEGNGTTPCERCGKRRHANNKHATLCGHCSREPEHLSVLAGGRWVRQGLVSRWVADPPAPPPEPAPKPQRELKPCGTHAAFKRHKGRGEDPCGECRDAERTYQRNRFRRNRAQKEAA
jgi:hypothetical protein